MKRTKHETGKLGEGLATRYLKAMGFKVLERNWRWRKCEIDIIAVHKGVLVFLEVKTKGERALDGG